MSSRQVAGLSLRLRRDLAAFKDISQADWNTALAALTAEGLVGKEEAGHAVWVGNDASLEAAPTQQEPASLAEAAPADQEPASLAEAALAHQEPAVPFHPEDSPVGLAEPEHPADDSESANVGDDSLEISDESANVVGGQA
ncbi:hypothetical protein OC844_007240 [Tilletia horrida]|nr:hypothetical protein OC844_007240 [Tilletia horrida]